MYDCVKKIWRSELREVVHLGTGFIVRTKLECCRISEGWCYSEFCAQQAHTKAGQASTYSGKGRWSGQYLPMQGVVQGVDQRASYRKSRRSSVYYPPPGSQGVNASPSRFLYHALWLGPFVGKWNGPRNEEIRLSWIAFVFVSLEVKFIK